MRCLICPGEYKTWTMQEDGVIIDLRFVKFKKPQIVNVMAKEIDRK